MPKSAYPKDFKFGADNIGFWMRLKNKYFTVPLTGSPRVTSGFWKFREYPIMLLALRGKGHWRWENTDGTYFTHSKHKYLFNYSPLKKQFKEPIVYLSRIQPYTRWGIILYWPLGLVCWIFWRKRDVIYPPRYKSNFGIKKLFTVSLGWIRDGDKLYRPTIRGFGNWE